MFIFRCQTVQHWGTLKNFFSYPHLAEKYEGILPVSLRLKQPHSPAGCLGQGSKCFGCLYEHVHARSEGICYCFSFLQQQHQHWGMSKLQIGHPQWQGVFSVPSLLAMNLAPSPKSGWTKAMASGPGCWYRPQPPLKELKHEWETGGSRCAFGFLAHRGIVS